MFSRISNFFKKEDVVYKTPDFSNLDEITNITDDGMDMLNSINKFCDKEAPKPKTYIEVSARGIGKTTRLVNAVIKWLKDPENVAYIQCYCYKDFISIKKMVSLDKRYHDRIFFMQSNKEYSELKDRETKNSRVFADDFDLIGADNFVFVSGGYYVTTPLYRRTKDNLVGWKLGTRNDSLLKLWTFAENNDIEIVQFKN